MSELTDAYITYSDVLRLGGGEQRALDASGLTADQAAVMTAQMNTGALDRNIYGPISQTPRAKASRRHSINERTQRLNEGMAPAVVPAEGGEAVTVAVNETPENVTPEAQALVDRWNAFQGSRVAGDDEAAFKILDEIQGNQEKLKAISESTLKRRGASGGWGGGATGGWGDDDKVVLDSEKGKPGTSGSGATVNSDGNVVFKNVDDFNKYMQRASAGLSRARAATKEAAGIDYQEQANEMARAQGEAREKYDREIREYEALQERQRLALDKTEQEMRMAEQELKDGTIDPNRAYGGVGGRVAAAFATAIGAFAQGISGGKIPNTALQIINSAIDRDIFAQKEEMRKRKDVLINKNNIYAQMMKRFGDERMAEQAAINMGYNVAMMKIGELATRHKGAAQQAAAQQLIAQAENKYAEGNARLAQLVQQRQARLGAAGRAKQGQTQKLFKNALAGAKKLLTMWNNLDAGYSAISGILGMVGPKVQQIGSSKKDVQYTAQVQNVAQNINKAFSGARGSDRDLAAVLLQMPDQAVFLGGEKAGREKGRALIKQLIGNLETAQVGSDGLIAKDAFANQMVKSGVVSEDQINEMIADERFKEFTTFLEGE